MKVALIKNNLDYELAPPNIHRRNVVERVICTFKNHFLAGLATCPHFPISKWDRLIEQAQFKLNLLKTSRINPKLSSQAYLFGNHDFNKVPLLPPGTQVVIHNKPINRASWTFHDKDRWYIGPAPEQYRCIKCYIPITHSTRITNTVAVILFHIPIPNSNLQDKLLHTSEVIVKILIDVQRNHTSFPFKKKSMTLSCTLPISYPT